eukprot:3161221-Amphidinium_carterae.1
MDLHIGFCGTYSLADALVVLRPEVDHQHKTKTKDGAEGIAPRTWLVPYCVLCMRGMSNESHITLQQAAIAKMPATASAPSQSVRLESGPKIVPQPPPPKFQSGLKATQPEMRHNVQK